MPRVTKHRGGERLNFDLWQPDHVSDTFADGVAEVQLGGAQIKIKLFQIRGAAPEENAADAVEERQVVSILTMNLATFVEAFSKVLATIAQNKVGLLAAHQEHSQNLAALLDNISQQALQPPAAAAAQPAGAERPTRRTRITRRPAP